MDKYDPKKEVGMIVDEWGTWYEVEPGTNPGFLYQQNTMRDALVAGINLNIFNKHSDRVKMANIAQMINVLQAVILTEGSKMIKTPTYHVFDMYKYHQDADLLDSTLETETVGLEEENMVPNLSESVSIDADGVMHITMDQPGSGTRLPDRDNDPRQKSRIHKSPDRNPGNARQKHLRRPGKRNRSVLRGRRKSTRRNQIHHSGLQCTAHCTEIKSA